MNVNFQKGFFYYYNIWETGNNVDENMKKRQLEQLEPGIMPYVIYNDSKFYNSECETKYKDGIENTIESQGKLWDDISLIVNVESRFRS